jgi:hypothetical protein
VEPGQLLLLLRPLILKYWSEKDPHYFEMAKKALPRLAQYKNGNLYSVTI